MLNITNTLTQLRTARRLGKISNSVQTRILRRMGKVSAYAMAQEANIRARFIAPLEDGGWYAQMALLKSINAEVEPVLQAMRVAERECFDVKYSVAPESRTAKLAKVTAKVKRPKLTGFEYTPQWWEAEDLRERAARKVARKAAKAAGVAFDDEDEDEN